MKTLAVVGIVVAGTVTVVAIAYMAQNRMKQGNRLNQYFAQVNRNPYVYESNTSVNLAMAPRVNIEEFRRQQAEMARVESAIASGSRVLDTTDRLPGGL